MEKVYDYYYENYLMLYSLYGRGRPRLSRERYEALDRELLSTMSQATGDTLDRSAAARISEIEYLLLDDIAESLLDTVPAKARRNPTGSVTASTPETPTQ